MPIKSWPTAVVLSVAVIALAAIILAGPALGVDPGTIRWLLGGEVVGAFALLASMRGLFHDDGPPDRTRDERRGDAS